MTRNKNVARWNQLFCRLPVCCTNYYEKKLNLSSDNKLNPINISKMNSHFTPQILEHEKKDGDKRGWKSRSWLGIVTLVLYSKHLHVLCLRGMDFALFYYFTIEFWNCSDCGAVYFVFNYIDHRRHVLFIVWLLLHSEYRK